MHHKWCLGILVMCLVVISGVTLAKPYPVGTVHSVAPMNTARAAHTATLLPDGRVLLAGGIQRDGVFLNSAELYDPATGLFSGTGDMTTARASHTATLLPDGTVLLVGGWTRAMLTSAEVYDPISDSFTLTGSMLASRNGFTATLLKNGKVLIAGLSTGSTSSELYDPESGTFAAAGAMNTPRNNHTATLLADGQVLIAGGLDAQGTVLATVEIFDPDTGTFTLIPNRMTVARHKQGAIRLLDGRVLIVGGADERDWKGRHRSTEIYDPDSGLFSPRGEMGEGRFKLAEAVTLLPNGNVLVAGASERIEMYQAAEERFETVRGQLDAARFFATATLLKDGAVLIAGGYDMNITATARVWLYQT